MIRPHVQPVVPEWLQRLIKFGGWGIFSFTLINVFLVVGHELVGLKEEAAFAVALVLVQAINFWMSSLYIFTPTQKLNSQITRYITVSIGARIFDFILFSVLLNTFVHHYMAASAITIILSFFSKFVLFYLWVFR